jgi:hypothetical protein
MTYSVVNPMLPYGNQSTITGLNSSSYFVGDGFSKDSNGVVTNQAVLWSPDGSAIDLQNSLTGAVDSIAYAINQSNESAGNVYYSTSSTSEAVVWSATGQPTILDDPGGMGATATLINDSGGVGGSVILGTNAADAAYWSPSGTVTLLGSTSGANGVNDTGYICGVSNGEAVVWDSTGAIVWSAGKASYVLAINANGETCGEDEGSNPTSSAHWSAAIWSPTGVETRLERPSIGGSSWVRAINSLGETCGYYNFPDGRHQDAVLWSPAGRATVLEKPLGGRAVALALNDRGDSVGEISTAHATYAAYWGPKGKLTDLRAILGPTWSGTEATGINSSGDIVGYGTVGGLQESFFLLNTAPAMATAPHFVESPVHHILAASAVPGYAL